MHTSPIIPALVLSISLLAAPIYAEENHSDLIEQATQATLLVHTELLHGFTMDDEPTGRWRGSAFVVNKENGWLVTNAHVAGYGPSKIRGRFIDQKDYTQLKSVFVDSLHDIAILQIDPDAIPTATQQLDLECDYTLQRGEQVFAVGHPKSQEFTATKGILSGNKNLHLDGDFYTTDLISEGGNSGGPVVRIESGKVVGIATSGFKGSDIGHLTKSRDICRILDALNAGRNPARPYLGFQTLIVDKEYSAFVANVVDPKSPLRFLDEILSWNGKTWNPATDGDLADQMRGYDQATVNLRIRRNGRIQTLQIPVKPGLSQHQREWIFFSGITLTESPHIDAFDMMPSGTPAVITVQSLDKVYDDVMEIEFAEYAEIISLNEIPITSLAQAYAILAEAEQRGEKVRIIARDMDYNPEAYMHYFQHSIAVEDLESSL
jgi:S1-C subfamily serine protease